MVRINFSIENKSYPYVYFFAGNPSYAAATEMIKKQYPEHLNPQPMKFLKKLKAKNSVYFNTKGVEVITPDE